MKKNPENPEEVFQFGKPIYGAEPEKIPDSFYSRHEKMMSILSEKYNCEIDELIPIVNLIKSN